MIDDRPTAGGRAEPGRTARTRVLIHTCGAPILVEVDALGGYRYPSVRTGDYVSRCPRCGRRLLRSGLRAVAPETVRGDR